MVCCEAHNLRSDVNLIPDRETSPAIQRDIPVDYAITTNSHATFCSRSYATFNIRCLTDTPSTEAAKYHQPNLMPGDPQQEVDRDQIGVERCAAQRSTRP